MAMPHIDYPNVIDEDVEELEKLEKRHRYSHLFHRVRMLRLLKSGECKNLSEAAEALGYSSVGVNARDGLPPTEGVVSGSFW
jgi:hypothetical protein